tara:strand:+ start:4690 stop:5229 length:540 start_codon:yes stop_codon:yes gene_type:complete
MFFLISILFVVFFSCSPKNEDFTNTYQIPKKASLIQVENASLPFKWDAPLYWLANEKSAMRSASYLVPSQNGSADLSVIYLNGDGGGLAANVNRWRKQLFLSELSEEEIIKSGSEFKGEIGLFNVYEISNPENKESAFLCSIIPAKDFTIFVKLNTYSNNLNSLKSEFIKFSSSFDYNE